MTSRPEPQVSIVPPDVPPASGETLLDVRNLSTHFDTREGVVKAVDGVSLSVARGEVLGIVGESGCGKSVTSLSIMGLVPKPGSVVGGEIIFNGQDVLDLDDQGMRSQHLRVDLMRFPIRSLKPENSLAMPTCRDEIHDSIAIDIGGQNIGGPGLILGE